jgi:hypothetical protein
VAEDELDGLPGDDEPHQQLHQAKHHRRFSYLVTGAPSSPHQTLALPSFQIAGNRGDGEESRHDVREPTIGRGGWGESRGGADGAESQSGVMERRGWMGGGVEKRWRAISGGGGGGRREEGAEWRGGCARPSQKFLKKHCRQSGTAERAGQAPAGTPHPKSQIGEGTGSITYESLVNSKSEIQKAADSSVPRRLHRFRLSVRARAVTGHLI